MKIESKRIIALQLLYFMQRMINVALTFRIFCVIICHNNIKKSTCIEELLRCKEAANHQLKTAVEEEVDIFLSQWKLKLLRYIDETYESKSTGFYQQIIVQIHDLLDHLYRKEYMKFNPALPLSLYNEYIESIQKDAHIDFYSERIRKFLLDGYFEFKLYKYKLIYCLSEEFKKENFLYAFSNPSQFKNILKSIFDLCLTTIDLLTKKYIHLNQATSEFENVLENLVLSMGKNSAAQPSFLTIHLEATKSFYALYKNSQRRIMDVTFLWSKLLETERHKWYHANINIMANFNTNMLRTFVQSIKNVVLKLPSITYHPSKNH